MSPGEDDLIGIPFPEHSNELLSHLNDQRRAGLLCDLTLTSRGARYLTHRSVMAAVSLYFRQLFGAEEVGGQGGREAEGGGGSFRVCQLDCVAPDALDALLEFAYTATLTIRSSGMRDVLRGAQLLGIKCVADACREILGETAEAEVQAEERAQHAERERAAAGEGRAEKGSRRKTDRKKVKKFESHPAAVSPLPPPPAISHRSPVLESLHSLPCTQPPSPEREEQQHHHHHHHHLEAGQNGDPGRGRAAEQRTTVNGGVHWPRKQPPGAHPPPAPPSNDRLSENEEMEGFGIDGVVAPTTTIPASVVERGLVASAVSGGRKRKSQTPQQCPVCQKIIHGAGKLPRHMRTHTGEKPFQCSACGVRFTRNDKLKIHMRKHTGERPYPCPHCPARFLHSYDLKNHLSLHSGARPFECPLCHKAFAREDHLQRHRKGHSCLEVRTRRPRRGSGHGEEGSGEGGGRDRSSPLEPHPLQAHSSAFLPRRLLSGGGNGSGAGPMLMFQGDVERERSLALQALAHLGTHGVPGYPVPDLLLRGLEPRGAREAEEEEEPGGGHSPAVRHDRWGEEMGEEEEEEE
ncbi:zinc finger and BTB domain-containing protein 7B [Lampris incognitus]|uniref:zinc finger and BTB domain-containing protein 7B n=1 Tax=Lampris incognitus TaxID=2546036 RepID=UPI0024B4DC1E|nr:zinc finger and BTB domain-containing protein 7B [Lampris incognitus]XP_056142283.1 zinc finger and BTB domain-containing protein 7B [Lampris incognitus]